MDELGHLPVAHGRLADGVVLYMPCLEVERDLVEVYS